MILAQGLNLQWGITGMVNFGVAGFYAIGAYTGGILSTRVGLPPELAIVLAAAGAGVVGLIVSLLTMRLREDYFAIVTLGFGEIVRLLALNEDWLTEGPRGLKISVRPFDFGLTNASYALVYLGAVAFTILIIYVICERIRSSPYGRVLRAIREDDVVASVLGKNIVRFRVQVFAIGSIFMGLAGALFAHYVQNISPDTFMPMIAIFIWMSVIVGGYGNNRGLLLGAGIVMVILEGSRFLGDFVSFVNSQQLASIRIILIGCILMVVLRFKPRGLIPEPKFSSPFERTPD
ncbi:MAG: branched-chain amino acid ABC transporter permease [Burkholderiales bacterium]|nr:branched-chain amino acid ABC transporter permease [Burkholderiales bacterium]